MLFLETTDTNLKHRNGQKVQVVREITEPDEGYDAACLPMRQIRFGDGFVTDVFPDELVKAAPRPMRYRNLL